VPLYSWGQPALFFWPSITHGSGNEARGSLCRLTGVALGLTLGRHSCGDEVFHEAA
jgi:hypothetical protein